MKMCKYIIALVPALLLSVQLFAEETKAMLARVVNNNEQGDWYTEPWVWVIALKIFSMIVIRILSERETKYSKRYSIP